MNSKSRCDWSTSDPLYVKYHDEEWGVPIYDDRLLFAKLILDGAQAGLSWITILRKRPHFRAVFAGFDPVVVADFRDDDVERLLGDPGIIRNRAKVAAAIDNARAFLEIQHQHGSFDSWLWSFVGGEPRRNAFRSLAEIPAQTETSVAVSKELKRRGFRFVGPTIMYAFMQAVGMVNDHTVDCFRYGQI